MKSGAETRGSGQEPRTTGVPATTTRRERQEGPPLGPQEEPGHAEALILALWLPAP